MLEALADNDKWNLMFVRHRSGPLYYMYIGSHPHFLRKRRDEFGQRNMGVHDIVVNDHAELLWRLQVFYALKNLRKKRVVAVGGAGGWGADGNLAPERAHELWSMDICHVTYPELGERIKRAEGPAHGAAGAGGSQSLPGPAWREAGNRGEFVDRAFLLTEVFRDLLDEHQTDSITINACMSTVMPISGTTACQTLSLLNDEGYLAFCESDFVVIPAGILLHYLSGKPVFLCNPSMPHKGSRDRVTLHGPSEDGRAPGLPGAAADALRIGFWRGPEGRNAEGPGGHGDQRRFFQPPLVGVRGRHLDSPFFPICRTQLDLAIKGDWERLAEEIRGFHWILAYGSHLRQVGYAVQKAGLGWLAVT